MARGLDHIVHAVKDLEAAGELYDMLGFTVGTRNRHPWGTHNRIVQFPGFFLELLEVAEPEAIPPHEDEVFSFGAFNRDFLAEVGPGLSMLVLESKDPAADKAAFDAAGSGGFKLFDFARTGRRPDGSDVEVAFTLAFARDPAAPHAGFFTSLQKLPDNFWAPDLQRHMNGVTGIAGAVLTADEPEAHLAFLEGLHRRRLPPCHQWLAPGADAARHHRTDEPRIVHAALRRGAGGRCRAAHRRGALRGEGHRRHPQAPRLKPHDGGGDRGRDRHRPQGRARRDAGVRAGGLDPASARPPSDRRHSAAL